MKQDNFWFTIRQLAQKDDSVEVPQATLEKAYDIYQVAQTSQVHVLRLVPMAAGNLRKAPSSTRKYFYELNDQVYVQMEVGFGENGFHISGFAEGMGDADALLFGAESVFKTPLEAGTFEFDGLPVGKYKLSVEGEGQTFWIPDLKIELPLTVD